MWALFAVGDRERERRKRMRSRHEILEAKSGGRDVRERTYREIFGDIERPWNGEMFQQCTRVLRVAM